MPLALELWSDRAEKRLGAIAAHPSLQPEFELLLGRGLARVMGDAYNRVECRRLANLDGEDAGFGYALLVPTTEGPFAAFRIGVIDRFRRRGVGRALLAALRESVARVAPEIHELELAAAVPNPAAEAFARLHGYQPTRTYWLMERPVEALPEPEWPAGFEARRFDDHDEDLARWVDVFNAAWKGHHHPILATVREFRQHLASGTVSPAGMYFAVRGGEPLGFVRGALHATRGEVAVLGVHPAARGIGLGRALLRFGGRWLVEHGASRVTLLVDGENERALRLYRGEGYEVIRTRQLWTLRI